MKYRSEIEDLLYDFRKRLEIVDKEIGECPEGHLIQSSRNGRPDFIQITETDSGRHRSAINKKPEIIQGLARKRYLQEEAVMIKNNICEVEKFLKKYKDITPESIIAKLPVKLQQLPETYFFAGSGKLPDNSVKEWMGEEYVQSDFRPWEKTHTTSTGIKVRSKSEVVIADKLALHGVPFRYEEVIYIENYRFVPDFIMMVQGELKYWEHCGKVNDLGYMKKHNWKLERYEKAGIVPWKNLILTYDDENGGIDSRIIESEIMNKLL